LIKFQGVFCAFLGLGAGDVHTTVLSDGASRDSRRNLSFLTFHTFCPVRGKIGVTDVHIMTLSIYEFRENGSREDCTFLKGANETIFTRVP